ncbi:hypothetical protein ACFX2G_005914 [Malus domestica]
MVGSAMVLDPKPLAEPPASIPSIRSDLQGYAEQSQPPSRTISTAASSPTSGRELEHPGGVRQGRAEESEARIQSVPLVIGQFMEMVDQKNGIVGSTTGSNYYVRILSTINRELLKPSASVALHRQSNALGDVLPPEADSSISLLIQSEKPDVTYSVSYAQLM